MVSTFARLVADALWRNPLVRSNNTQGLPPFQFAYGWYGRQPTRDRRLLLPQWNSERHHLGTCQQ